MAAKKLMWKPRDLYLVLVGNRGWWGKSCKSFILPVYQCLKKWEMQGHSDCASHPTPAPSKERNPVPASTATLTRLGVTSSQAALPQQPTRSHREIKLSIQRGSQMFPLWDSQILVLYWTFLFQTVLDTHKLAIEFSNTEVLNFVCTHPHTHKAKHHTRPTPNLSRKNKPFVLNSSSL